jgi:hypothetical protein
LERPDQGKKWGTIIKGIDDLHSLEPLSFGSDPKAINEIKAIRSVYMDTIEKCYLSNGGGIIATRLIFGVFSYNSTHYIKNAWKNAPKRELAPLIRR